MIISKEQLTQYIRADKSDRRTTLHGICFTKEGAVSTDGKSLLLIPYPEKVNGLEQPAHADHEHTDDFIMSAQDVRILSTNFNSRIGITKDFFAKYGGCKHEDGKIEFATKAHKIDQTTTVEAVSGTYPEWRNLAPEYTKDDIEIHFCPKRLAALLNKIHKASKNESVTLRIKRDESTRHPVKMTTPKGIEAVIMPMRRPV